MKTLSFIMAVMLFTTPYLTLAQQTSDAAQAIFDARRDATLANTQIWGAVGCLLGVTGMLIAYVVTPTVLPEKLLGKSPEYVAYYTSTYQKLVKNDQITHATIGCVIGTGTMVGLWIILISAADSPYGY